jgi:hypothetical protein
LLVALVAAGGAEHGGVSKAEWSTEDRHAWMSAWEGYACACVRVSGSAKDLRKGK